MKATLGQLFTIERLIMVHTWRGDRKQKMGTLMVCGVPYHILQGDNKVVRFLLRGETLGLCQPKMKTKSSLKWSF